MSLRLQGRQIVEVQLDPGEIYHAWYVSPLSSPLASPPLPIAMLMLVCSLRYPTVTRVRRTVQYLPSTTRKRTVERHIYW